MQIEVVNWLEYNPRSDRKVYTWFRFQNNFFMNHKMHGLSDTAKLVWIFILCEASKNFGESTNVDTFLTSNLLRKKEAEVIESIRSLTHLGVIAVTVKTPDGNSTNVTNERDVRTKREGATAVGKRPLPPLVEIWNANCGNLPKVAKSNPQRDRKSKLIWPQNSPEEWTTIVKRIAASDFCTGRNDRGWMATFDWLLQPEVHLKVAEGKYDNRSGGPTPPDKPDLSGIFKGGRP